MPCGWDQITSHRQLLRLRLRIILIRHRQNNHALWVYRLLAMRHVTHYCEETGGALGIVTGVRSMVAVFVVDPRCVVLQTIVLERGCV